MPANKSAAIRHRIIDNCLRSRMRRFPSLEDLANECSRILDQDVSTSTIEKDIRAMKAPRPAGYEAPIIYNRREDGYYYDEPGYSINSLSLTDTEWEALRYASLLLYQYREVPVFENFKNAIERINTTFEIQLDLDDPFLVQYIQFEKGVSTTGYEWIADIFSAIRDEHTLTITYENIYKSEIKTYQVVPYLLKEYRNRWYLIGWVAEREDYLTFALDRISTLEAGTTRQRRRVDFDYQTFLKSSVGIMEGDGNAVQVKLKFTKPYNHLVKLEPLHQSQEIVSENSTTLSVQLTVFLNPELTHRILSYGPHCKVITPAALKNEVKEKLAAALAQY